MTERGYAIQFDPLPEGGFSVFVPAIPEICTFGATLEEACEMAEDAIRCYVESENEIQTEARTEAPMERAGDHDVYAPAKGGFEVGKQTAGKPRGRRAHNVDQQVDVAVLTSVAARHRTFSGGRSIATLIRAIYADQRRHGPGTS